MTSRGEVIRRAWRSGPRGVKRTAWGYTVQIAGKQVRKFDANWTQEQAQQALDEARGLRGAEAEPAPQPAPTPAAPVTAPGVTFKEMTERYLRDKGRKRSLKSDRWFIDRLVAHFGGDTPLVEITAPKITAYRLQRLTTKS